ncbi:hypothetical protein GCM10011583_20620 [Streptomyces camponoticapitis]|uniref:Uncharacterized protein n=1 Tax=Streptomyces camponoticapitis TaxID=1616125 RepID=A0ABQ2E284_9ACTN|nr:hypothetical protein GCM10011583_20620 [Streptomyces camponoticapitis]
MIHVILSRFQVPGKRPSRAAGRPIDGGYAWWTVIVDAVWCARMRYWGSGGRGVSGVVAVAIGTAWCGGRLGGHLLRRRWNAATARAE